ncbi:MAG: enoyl-CoA hydratase/isomerase family protein [Alphaproteobacteria bacterium]|nr:enoyl-CoA hydratase/isomerase family protein [Alphaproteobacteria bacterium]MBU0798664.1 enoyl-CoA hydratase/isomerase family protein [Alphaproteobacteria bacterium]MBU0885927.1 enoyl-CoA hydratase/isomerase family protein [Alphaproteobacteria bacterium]MBU1811916.1 enoyl-CoA hydratase/isomerase family protein [Alphaproteobacteria bacterium]MBU2090671.1 enoyl-CoA hydratase/isomerase family protein [Alphaproteobacteria bacterium]
MSDTNGSVRVEISERTGGCVARVTITHARKLNTLNSALMTEFAAALDALGRDESLCAVVLTGEGEKAFVGGANIDEMAGLDAHSARDFITRVHGCCDAVRRLPVPVIARIQGFTLGAGLELAAACDLRIAADKAVFGMPEVKLGIPSVVEAALLPGLIGWGRTRQILLLGETFSAAEAAQWGLVEKVVPFAALDSAVDEWLDSLLANGPVATRQQKKLIRDWEDLPLRAAVAAGIDCFAESWKGEEPRRLMADFIAAREAEKARRRADLNQAP